MQIKAKHIRKLKKVAGYSLATIFIFLILSLAATGLFLYNITHFQQHIKNLVVRETGFEINFATIKGKLNSKLQPEINIANLSVSKVHVATPFLAVGNLNFAIAYQSIFKRSLVFSHLELSHSNLNVEYDKHANLLINNQLIANLRNSNSSSDSEELLLQQQLIKLSGLNLRFLDSRDKLKPINLKQIELTLANAGDLKHKLLVTATNRNSTINLSLNLDGEKLSKISSWQDGDLAMTSKDRLNHNIDVRAQVQNGRLLFLTAVFDTNAHHVPGLNNTLESNTALSGILKITQDSNNRYDIVGHDLVMSTPAGYFLNHATIDGHYTFNQAGAISLSGISLDGLSSLTMFQLGDSIALNGEINNVKFSWYGPITRPHDFLLTAKLKNIALIPAESNIPGINHINGDVTVKPKSGVLNLHLVQSRITFPKQLNQPLIINDLTNTTIWNLESANAIKFAWQNTKLKTADFNLLMSGTYATRESMLELHASMPSLAIAAIPRYLPANISVISDFIKKNMRNGSLNNLDLEVRGDVKKLPFTKGGGNLQFNSQFKDVTLKFDPDFGEGRHLSGIASLHNQAASLKLKSGSLGDYHIAKTSINVADVFADKQIINVDGYASGLTKNLLTYLTTTPLKTKILALPKNMIVQGYSELFLKLMLPIDTPKKLTLDGSLDLHNNSFDFASDLPDINSINGKMSFSADGIRQSNFTANILNSKIELSISDKQIVKLYSPDLDYSAIMRFYFKGKDTGLIAGRAKTYLAYDIKESRSKATTNLQGVSINAVAPLSKSESEIRNLTIDVVRLPGTEGQKVDVNYANILFSRINLTENRQFKQAKIAIGSNDYFLKHQNGKAAITVLAKLQSLYLNDWIDFIQKIQALSSDRASNNKSGESISAIQMVPSTKMTPVTAHADTNIYPLQIEVATASIWYNNYNIDGGSIDILVGQNKVNGKINTPAIAGQIEYQMDKNKAAINLDRFLFSTTDFVPPTTSKPDGTNIVQATPGTKHKTRPSNIPDINLSIRALYYQNHYLGNLQLSVLQRNNNLYIENALLTNKAASTRFRVIDHYQTAESGEYTELRLRSKMTDFGLWVAKLGLDKDIRRGSGVFDLSLAWNGGIADFDYKKTKGSASLNVKNGEFIHVNPGLLGSLLGVVSLTSITNVTSINLNTFFGHGFAFDSWDTDIKIVNDKIRINKFKLVSTAASISTFGKIDLATNTIDSYLTVEPRLGATIATTAGIVTLNPLIGMLVYVGQAIVGNPVNKALAINYHVYGNIESPVLEATKLSDQISHNFNSTTGSIQDPMSAISNIEVNK